MERLMKGDIVVVPFPFSNLSKTKRRPALIVADLEGDDFILCQITSEANKDRYAIALSNKDFKSGSLKVDSMIRPNKLFTADASLVLYRIGSLRESKIKEIEDRLVGIIGR
ncbi:MAG: type II toxin-antitoxin system PemK/MazF family toxin [Candidatus Altiarchaeota archaeon]|nr:type II toxin-antitoxin system PemK/MazF family toxin [Candidatus Altiarchaeota archaeon]